MSNKKPTFQVSTISNLPPDLIADILSRIPPKDLIRFMCVSRAYYATIPDRKFINVHQQRAIRTNSFRILLIEGANFGLPNAAENDLFSLAFYDNDTFGTIEKIEPPLKRPGTCTHILGYSNGLVCIRNTTHSGDEGDFAIWNPSIQKFKKIPSTSFEQPTDLPLGHPHYGFGYDSANDDYKFVKIVEFLDGDGVITGAQMKLYSLSAQVKVYSLKSNSWKRIPNISTNGFGVDSENILFLKGALSWLTRNVGDYHYRILSLDLATEQRCEFPTPVNGDENSRLFLDVLGDFLCICVDHFYIRKKYGEAESWSLIFSVDVETMRTSLGCFKPWRFQRMVKWFFLRITMMRFVGLI